MQLVLVWVVLSNRNISDYKITLSSLLADPSIFTGNTGCFKKPAASGDGHLLAPFTIQVQLARAQFHGMEEAGSGAAHTSLRRMGTSTSQLCIQLN